MYGDELLSRLSAAPAALTSRALTDARWIIRHAPSIQELRALAGNADAPPHARARAVWALRLLGGRNLRTILRGLLQERVDSSLLQWEICKGIVEINFRGVAATLAAALSDRSLAGREAVVWALGFVGRKKDRLLLEGVLRDRTEPSRIRGEAAEALGNLASRDSVPALISGLRDRSSIVRFWCAYALGEIGDPSAVGSLKIRSGDRSKVHGLGTVGAEARRALRKIR